jgi:hypothetical protein
MNDGLREAIARAIHERASDAWDEYAQVPFDEVLTRSRYSHVKQVRLGQADAVLSLPVLKALADPRRKLIAATLREAAGHNRPFNMPAQIAHGVLREAAALLDPEGT